MVNKYIFNQWIQTWFRARMQWHSTSNFGGYNIRFWQAALQTRIWLPIKNAITVCPHAYVITVPHIAISVWFYCLLVTLRWQLYATTIAFYVSLKQRDRLLAVQYIWRQSWWNFYVWTIHTNHCL